MKKFLSIVLAVLMVATVFSMVGCGQDKENDETLKMGLGVYSEYGSSKNADGETNGSVKVATTASAVLLDKDGKIVKCLVDTVECEVSFTSLGAIVVKDEYKTKGEQGESYNMVAYGGATKEWFEQADAFCKVVEGKTLDEVKALIVEGDKGNDEVIAAGCTIMIGEFVKAVEKAYANALDTNATAKDELSLSFVSKIEKASDATEEKNGSCEVVSNICAVATNAEVKVTAIKTDVALAKVAFTLDGALVTDTEAALSSKREQGNGYGMSAYGQDLNGDGVVKEWFEQADALEAACIGKTADEIASLVVDGYGVESLQTAGCTIAISDIVASVVKAAK